MKITGNGRDWQEADEPRRSVPQWAFTAGQVLAVVGLIASLDAFIMASALDSGEAPALAIALCVLITAPLMAFAIWWVVRTWEW